MEEKKCRHLVLDECSQEHHNNCLGMQKCILDLEQQLQLKDKMIELILLHFEFNGKHCMSGCPLENICDNNSGNRCLNDVNIHFKKQALAELEE